VLYERNLILGPDRDKAAIYIIDWRQKAVIKTIQLFQVVKDVERTTYGGKSYFNFFDRYPDSKFLFFDNSPEVSDNEIHTSLAPEQSAGHK